MSVAAPGAIEAEREALATEIVAYLAAHPAGVHLNVLTGAVWPRGVTTEVRDSALARVRDWLGYDAAGQPQLAADATGRLRLGQQVRIDWQVFRALVAHAGQEPVQGSDAEAGYLERALGRSGARCWPAGTGGRYAWLATDDLEYEVAALVADAAHRLSVLRRGTDPAAAMAAARAGLLLATGDEMLWRDLLLAAAATGDVAAVHAVVTEISARAAPGAGRACHGPGNRVADRRAAAILADFCRLTPAPGRAPGVICARPACLRRQPEGRGVAIGPVS